MNKNQIASIIGAAVTTAVEVAVYTLKHAGHEVTVEELEEAKAYALLDVSALNLEELAQKAKEWAIVRGGK